MTSPLAKLGDAPPVRVFLLSGVEMLHLLLPPSIAVAGWFSVLTDRGHPAGSSA